MHNSYRVGGVVAHEILVSAQGPLVLGFWAKGLGPGLDNFARNCVSSARNEVDNTTIPNHLDLTPEFPPVSTLA